MKYKEVVNKLINNLFGVLVITLVWGCTNSEGNAPTTQNSCLPPGLMDHALAIYTFNNGSLEDTSGNNYHLTNPTTASIGSDRSGNQNCAYQFNDANGDYLELVNPEFLNDIQTTDLSISFWIKPIDNSYAKLLIREDLEFCNHQMGLWNISFINSRLNCVVGSRIVGGVHPGQNGVWKHIVMTINASDLILYINGIPHSGIEASTVCNPMNVGNLYIGRSYNGSMDDIFVFDKVLTPEEVMELYNITACCS
ncbi:MAG: LamG domain-containing protein [Flavobacterium sp.]|nr:LamG domain-containing protein [Flavobacterium sp.]